MMVEIDAASCYMKKTNIPMTKSLSKLNEATYILKRLFIKSRFHNK